MPYSLKAVMAPAELLTPPPSWAEGSRVVALAQEFAMVPLADALIYRYGPDDRPWLYERHSIFYGLPEALVPKLVELSTRGPVAYVEADYHGGDGEQRSIVWVNGEVRQRAEESSRAINDALLSLGVEPEEGRDRFDTLGLGRQRRVEDWLRAEEDDQTEGAPAPAPASVTPAAARPTDSHDAASHQGSLFTRLKEAASALLRGSRPRG
jgi:hypothetical protein